MLSCLKNVKKQQVRARKVFEMHFASYILVSIGPKRSLETNISKKKLSPLPVTKDFDLLLVLSSVTYFEGQILRVQKVL